MAGYAIVRLVALLCFGAAVSPALAQPDNAAQAAIRAALTQWTADFNAGHAQKVCDLFAPDVIADVQGQPPRDYAAVCGVLTRSLADRDKTYTYSARIHEILVSGDFAIVRLVWTLTVKRKDGAPDVTSVEPGMDLFRRQADGSWKIARYMSFEAP